MGPPPLVSKGGPRPPGPNPPAPLFRIWGQKAFRPRWGGLWWGFFFSPVPNPRVWAFWAPGGPLFLTRPPREKGNPPGAPPGWGRAGKRRPGPGPPRGNPFCAGVKTPGRKPRARARGAPGPAPPFSLFWPPGGFPPARVTSPRGRGQGFVCLGVSPGGINRGT